MCTAIAKKGNDLIYGFNLDIDPSVWNFKLLKTKHYFSVGITVGSTTYLTHGINSDGQFGNVPYMNGEPYEIPKGKKRERIDLLNDRYIRGRYTSDDIDKIIEEKSIVNIPDITMHSLIGNKSGEFMIIEPGYGIKKITDDFAAITNFPILADLKNYDNPFYGKDRCDKAVSILKNSGADFSVNDALDLLKQVKQEGQWGTRISFVYSKNENAVHYCLNGDFNNIMIHCFD